MTELIIAVLAMAACVYGTSSAVKLANRRNYLAYRDDLSGTGLIPASLLGPAAAVLAGGETVTAAIAAVTVILTIAGTPASAAAAASALALGAVLAGVLTAGVAVVIRSGTRATCACFGASSGQQITGSHLIRNTAILILLLTGLAGNAFRQGRPTIGAAVIALAAGAVLAMLLIRFDDLASLFAPSRRRAVR